MHEKGNVTSLWDMVFCSLFLNGSYSPKSLPMSRRKYLPSN